MVDVKIGDLPPLGAAPAADDMLEIKDISETKSLSITMANLAEALSNKLIYFSARSNIGQVLTANVTLVEYSNNVVDPFNVWTGNNTFTAPKTAKYTVVATCATTTATRSALRALVDAGNHVYGAQAGGSASDISMFSYTFNLTIGQTLTFIYGASETRNATGFRNMISIKEVG
tara:strand:- start:2904 stop:3425 length:522 start_codon:yes stop_codon:yes gene_type:complete